MYIVVWGINVIQVIRDCIADEAMEIQLTPTEYLKVFVEAVLPAMNKCHRFYCGA